MVMQELTIKDKKILALLAMDPRQSYTQIGKRIGLSANAVRYKIGIFQKKNIIQGFSPVIDYEAAGFYTFDVFFSIRADEKEVAVMQEAIRRHGHIIWSGMLFGNNDLFAQFLARDIAHFNTLISQFCKKFEKNIVKYHTEIVVDRFKLEHFVPELEALISKKIAPRIKSNIKKLDELDKKILRALSKDSLAQYPVIASECNVSMETARNRVKSLINGGIIERFFTEFNYSYFGYENFIVFFSVNNNAEKENAFISHLKENPSVKLIFKTINENKIYTFCIFKSVKELEILWRNIKHNYGDAVQEMTYYVMTEEIKLDMWPL